MAQINYKIKSSAGPYLDIDLYKATNSKGLVQILHGMQEHKGRYRDFAKFLQESGYHVLIHDHLGHGASVDDNHPLGDMVSLDKVLEDIKLVKKSFDFKGKYIVFGHSMGSFLARIYASSEQMDKLIACGTGQTPNILSSLMKASLSFSPYKKPVNYVHKIMASKMGAKFKNKLEWLSYNKDNQEAYKNDPLCGRPFTREGYETLFDMTKRLNSKETYRDCKAKEILLIAGQDDPVGDFGKGVDAAFEKYRQYGHQIDQILYKNMTHEILMEDDKHKVYQDILEFIEK